MYSSRNLIWVIGQLSLSVLTAWSSVLHFGVIWKLLDCRDLSMMVTFTLRRDVELVTNSHSVDGG